jgi:transcriptional regulator with PAS, ATPase and Fis domain
VPFGDEAIAELVRSGFPEERAVRYFAMFFQLRRAFYFILGSLAGQCESMRRLREALWNNVFTHDMRDYEAALWNRMEDFSTLLLGETGTGKGSAAAAIGRSEFIPYLPEQRRFAANFSESFITINLSQFPETLIESELFGHRKGAFTGAIDHHEGVFERCSAHGALFLDEIGEVSIPVQIKLLQVLQERTFTALGGHEKKRFSGRVIAATNRPLDKLRRDGRFREDFFYRLCSDVIEVPTLRQRIAESPSELEQLVQLLVVRIAGEQASELASSIMEALARGLPRGYAWPGNVRELEQAVRRILLTGRYAGDIAEAATNDEELLAEKLRAGELTAEELLARYCALLYRRLGTYAEVAKRTGLDPRTSRKYVESAASGRPGQARDRANGIP